MIWLLHGVPNVETDSDESNFQEPRVSFAFNLSGAYAGGDPWNLTQESIIYFEDDWLQWFICRSTLDLHIKSLRNVLRVDDIGAPSY